jgi:hypothetical protein
MRQAADNSCFRTLKTPLAISRHLCPYSERIVLPNRPQENQRSQGEFTLNSDAAQSTSRMWLLVFLHEIWRESGLWTAMD